jgi:hypothetical protein
MSSEEEPKIFVGNVIEFPPAPAPPRPFFAHLRAPTPDAALNPPASLLRFVVRPRPGPHENPES